MTTTAKRLAGLVLALGVYALDQWIKFHVRTDWGVLASHHAANLRGVPDQGVSLGLPFFRLLWTENYGVSLGLFTAGSPEGRWALVAMTGAIGAFVLVWLLRERKLADILALGLVLGGAAGNIRDRYTIGFVIDYADLHFGNFRPFLIFNLADAAITIGVLIILARSLLSREKPQAEAETRPDAHTNAS